MKSKKGNIISRNWNTIATNTIVAVLVSLLLFFANSYRLKFEEDAAYRIEEAAQDVKINICEDHYNEERILLSDKFNSYDTLFSSNSREHEDLINRVDKLNRKISNLTFVIIKNNERMEKDLLEIKRSQNSFYTIAKDIDEIDDKNSCRKPVGDP